MPAGQAPERWYPDEFKQMVLRRVLDYQSYTQTKEFLAKLAFLVTRTSLVDATVE
jgi:hypothetical protein